jgi:hypothetical protein
MSLKFRFRFRDSSIEIHPAVLAARDPFMAGVRAECIQAAHENPSLKDDQARENYGDQIMAGLVARATRLHGDAYLAKVRGGLNRIADARNHITGELENALKGARPDFEKMKRDYDEIDLAIPEVVAPEDAVPPMVPLETLLAGGVAREPITGLADFLGRVPERATELRPEQSRLLDRANQIAPEPLRKLLQAENRESLKPATGAVRPGRPFEDLTGALRQAGWSQRDINRLADTVGGLNEAWNKRGGAIPEGYQAHVEAAMAALADPARQVPEVGRLQLPVSYSPVMRGMLRDNPTQLIEWWKDYLAETRTIGFSRYVAARMNSVKGHLGEFTAAFELGRSGVLVFLKGPKADVNEPGTDLICYDRNTGEQFYIDNKAVKALVLNGVSALIKNFPKNMTDDIAMMRATMGANPDPVVQDVVRRAENANRRIQDFLRSLPNDAQLREERLKNNYKVTLSTGERRPVWDVITEILSENGITRLVTNAGGQVERLRTAIADTGVVLEDLNVAEKGETE